MGESIAAKTVPVENDMLIGIFEEKVTKHFVDCPGDKAYFSYGIEKVEIGIGKEYAFITVSILYDTGDTLQKLHDKVGKGHLHENKRSWLYMNNLGDPNLNTKMGDIALLVLEHYGVEHDS
jgi:hypothetical protein